jgi:gamma-F420-2:alpha-L-glutamate ligase
MLLESMPRGLIIYNKKENEITDYSVLRLLESARSKNIDLSILTPEQFELVVTRSDRNSILVDDQTTLLPDFILPRIGSFTSFYALSVIRQLEHCGVYSCNSANAIQNVKDKLLMHQILAYSKLPTPKTMLAKFPVDISVVKREIGVPLIIKNVTGTQGRGVYLCESEEKFSDIMELIYVNNNNANIIIQEFIETSYGKDLRVFVIGGKVVGCMQRIAKSGFKANFSIGADVQPFELTPETEWMAIEAARLLNLDVAGVDLLFGEDGKYLICEANASPQFHGLENIVGQRIADDILDYVLVKIGMK